MNLNRRMFVGALSAAAGSGLLHPNAASAGATSAPAPTPANTTVRMYGDGLGLTPREMAEKLAELAALSEIGEDSYLIGGAVARFEENCARLLGKETAVLMPSGTLANQLALRALAGARRRVIVPDTSHIYNDTGDACQTLSQLTLLPVGNGSRQLTVEAVDALIAQTAGGRVKTEIGAIAIESPIRRLSGQFVDTAEIARVSAYARERGIGMHLDGARLFIASAYTKIDPAEYAATFDTVYVSLWKYFNSGIGAILAGPKHLLQDMFHIRRMFGGNLAIGWPAAVLAQHYMDGFVERLREAVALSETFFAQISSLAGISVERVEHGTNVSRIRLNGIDPATFVQRLSGLGVMLSMPQADGSINIQVNETWRRRSADALTEAFHRALR